MRPRPRAQRPVEPARAAAEVADALTAAELAELRAHYASQGAQLDALLGAGVRFAAAWAEPRLCVDSTNGSGAARAQESADKRKRAVHSRAGVLLA